MDKGIRAFARNHFVEQNELRRRGLEPYNGPKANTVFRKSVMACLMKEFGCSEAAAATHYNEAFKTVKEANPELVAGLGRPEDKKGGRKPKNRDAGVTPAASPTREQALAEMLAELPAATVPPHVAAELEEMEAPF